MKVQKYTNRKSAVTALLLAVIFFTISTLTGCANSPAKQFIAAATKSTVGVLSGILPKLLSAYMKPANPFSTDIDVSIEEMKFPDSSYDVDVIDFLKELELNLKADIKPNNVLLYAGLNHDGDDILTGTLTQDKNGIGFYLPELADEEYYVISDLDEFLQELDYYSDDEEEDAGFEPVKDLGLAASKCLKRYFAFTTACVTNDNVEIEKNEDIEFNLLHKEVDNCKVLTFQPDSDDLKTLFENIADELEDDEELAEFLASAAKINPTIDMALKQLLSYDYSGDNNYERILDMLNGLSEKLGDAAEDLAEGIENADFKMEYVLYKGNVVRTEILFDIDGKDASFIQETYSEEKTTETAAAFKIDDIEMFRADIETEELSKNKSDIEATVTVYDGYYDEDIVSIEFNAEGMDMSKKSALGVPYGEYEFTVNVENVAIKASCDVGKGDEGGSDHVLKLTVPNYDYYNDFYGNAEIELNIHSTDKPCTAKKPDKKDMVDISGYSPEELEEIFEEIGGNFYSLLNLLKMNF